MLFFRATSKKKSRMRGTLDVWLEILAAEEPFSRQLLYLKQCRAACTKHYRVVR